MGRTCHIPGPFGLLLGLRNGIYRPPACPPASLGPDRKGRCGPSLPPHSAPRALSGHGASEQQPGKHRRRRLCHRSGGRVHRTPPHLRAGFHRGNHPDPAPVLRVTAQDNRLAPLGECGLLRVPALGPGRNCLGPGGDLNPGLYHLRQPGTRGLPVAPLILST